MNASTGFQELRLFGTGKKREEKGTRARAKGMFLQGRMMICPLPFHSMDVAFLVMERFNESEKQ